MMKRGCATAVLFVAGIFAVYYVFFTRYFEWPGNLIAAAGGALFGAMGVGGMSHLYFGRRETAAFDRASRAQPPVDRRLTVVAGPIRPLGLPLASPFGGQPCVAYEYEVAAPAGGARRNESRPFAFAGFAMTASAVETRHGNVRLLGFPMLDEFPKAHEHGPAAQDRARRFIAATSFEQAQGVGALRMFPALDDALSDADGILRKDFRLTDDQPLLDTQSLAERVVPVGAEVVAMGRYDADKRALVPAGTTLNRLWPGKASVIRRELRAKARSQARLGFVLFVVSHALLAGAFYASETRHRRESESQQATVIRLAVQDGDQAALERAVRRGANPNARDAFGDAVLLDVRDPDMAAALLRLGADPNVRHRGDLDTPLIRASRMGIEPLVRVLLAAGADPLLETQGGATALSEAVRGGHAEVAAMLRAAGVAPDGPPVER